MTNVNGIIICTSKQGFRKATCVENKTETKHPQLGLLYSAKHFAMYCDIAALINTFGINILNAFGDDALSLCKPAKQF